jgi:hypothetical protein
MTAQMTDALTSQHNTKAIVDDLQTIIDSLSTLTKGDVLAVGTKLNEVITKAREAYQTAQSACGRCGMFADLCQCQHAPVKTCQRCGKALPADYHGRVCQVCLTPATPVERVRHECPDCGRSWHGNDLAPVGTIERRQCALCAKKASTPAPEVSQPFASTIADGTYTVEFGDGTYRTLRIKTQEPEAAFMPGKRIASYLNGPDNWANYQSFAFVNDDNTFAVWKKHQSASTVISALAVLLSGKEAMVNGLRAYGMASGKCGICGRKLTTPESIKRGIGPDCAARLGL